jgi:hypothetical protein
MKNARQDMQDKRRLYPAHPAAEGDPAYHVYFYGEISARARARKEGSIYSLVLKAMEIDSLHLEPRSILPENCTQASQ